MEGVPRMPMIHVEMKVCTGPPSETIGEKLITYIRAQYTDDIESYKPAVADFVKLRENAIKVAPDLSGSSLLKKYYGQLLLMKNRFPMRSGGACAVGFTWLDKFFDMPTPFCYEDIDFEVACILHNIGAIHSFLASLDSRVTAEGMKVSCTHFQCAAWCFQQLRDGLFCENFSTDFDRSMLTWYINLMLAQAQECILEKSLVDNRKNSIIAKVAVQIVEFYKQCLRALEQPSIEEIVGSPKSWIKACKTKQHYYMAIAYYQMGTQAEADQAFGRRLAYMDLAAKELDEAAKMAKKDSQYAASIQFATDVIVGKQQNAKKENDFIYHDKIPETPTLTDLKGASLVKCIPFDPFDPEICGPDLFSRILPLEIHTSASLYSEEKAQLLRDVVAKVDAKDAELLKFLESYGGTLELPEKESALLPDDVVERCAALNARKNFVDELEKKLKELADHHATVESTLKKIADKLNEIKTKPTLALEPFKAQITAVTADHSTYADADAQASKSNSELSKALGGHTSNLAILGKPIEDLKKDVPPPPEPATSTPEGKQLGTVLEKLYEMRTQRRTLLEQLRTEVRDDDISKHLLAEMERDPTEIFTRELKKHSKTIDYLDANMSAQPTIITAVTKAHADMADVRAKIDKTREKRQDFLHSLVISFETAIDLDEKANRGVTFYRQLAELVSALSARTEELCQAVDRKAEEVEKQKAEAEAAALAARTAPPQAAGSGRGAIVGGGPPGPRPGGGGGKDRVTDYMAFFRAKQQSSQGDLPSMPGPTPGAGGTPNLGQRPPVSAPGGGQYRPQIPMPSSGQIGHPTPSYPNGPAGYPGPRPQQQFWPPTSAVHGPQTTSFQPQQHSDMMQPYCPPGPMQYPQQHTLPQGHQQQFAQKSIISQPQMVVQKSIISQPQMMMQIPPTAGGQFSSPNLQPNLGGSGQQQRMPQPITGGYPQPTAGQCPSASNMSHIPPSGAQHFPHTQSGQGQMQGMMSHQSGHQQIPQGHYQPQGLYQPQGGYTAVPSSSQYQQPQRGMMQQGGGGQQSSGGHSMPIQSTAYSQPSPQPAVTYTQTQTTMSSGYQPSGGGQPLTSGQNVNVQFPRQHQQQPSGQMMSYGGVPAQQQQLHLPSASSSGVPSPQFQPPQSQSHQQIPPNSSSSGCQLRQHPAQSISPHGQPSTPLANQTTTYAQQNNQFGGGSYQQQQGRTTDGQVRPQGPLTSVPNVITSVKSPGTTSTGGMPPQTQQRMPQQNVVRPTGFLATALASAHLLYGDLPTPQSFSVSSPGPAHGQQNVNPAGQGVIKPGTTSGSNQQQFQPPQSPSKHSSAGGGGSGGNPTFNQNAGGHLTNAGGHPTIGGQNVQRLPGPSQPSYQQPGFTGPSPGGFNQQNQQQNPHQFQTSSQQPQHQGATNLGPTQPAATNQGVAQQGTGHHSQGASQGPRFQSPQSSFTVQSGQQVQGQQQHQQAGYIVNQSSVQRFDRPHADMIMSQDEGNKQLPAPLQPLAKKKPEGGRGQNNLNQNQKTQPRKASDQSDSTSMSEAGGGANNSSIRELQSLSESMSSSVLTMTSGTGGVMKTDRRRGAAGHSPVVVGSGAVGVLSVLNDEDVLAHSRSSTPKSGVVQSPIDIDRIDRTNSASPSSSVSSSPRKKNQYSKTATTANRTSDAEKPPMKRSGSHDPFVDDAVLRRFASDVEKFEKHVRGLPKKSLNGPTNLEVKWRELLDAQDQISRKHSISVARCASAKNRYPEVMPYDDSRVIINTAKDDYINASHVKNLSHHLPNLILTQAPLPNTLDDFWLMCFQEGVEVVVCLAQDSELKPPYFPATKSTPTRTESFIVTLQSRNDSPSGPFTQRVLSIHHVATKQGRTLVHLQFNGWPVGNAPESPKDILRFIREVQTFHKQQRSPTRPVVVHCLSGASRSGVFTVIYAAVMGMLSTGTLPCVPTLVNDLRACRKYAISDQAELLFTLKAVGHFAQELLMKRGIITGRASFEEVSVSPAPGKEVKGHSRNPSQDILFDSTISFSAIQSMVSKKNNAHATVANGGNNTPLENGGNTVLENGGNTTAPLENGQKISPGPDTMTNLRNGVHKTTVNGGNADLGPTGKKSENGHYTSSENNGEQQPHQQIPGLGGAKDKDGAPPEFPQQKEVILSPKMPQGTKVPSDEVEAKISSLVQLHPDSFKDGSKRRTTKLDFTDPGQIGRAFRDPGEENGGSDPLGSLDPLWSLKKKL